MSTNGLRALGAAIIVLAACGGQNDLGALVENPVAGVEQKFWNATAGAQPSCNVADLTDHITQFFAALNAGEPDIAERFFTDGTGLHFQWFSFTDRDAGGPGHFATLTPDSLNEYFSARHAVGDRFHLRGAKFITGGSDGSTIAFSPILFDYHVRDFETSSMVLHFGMGKGGYHCEAGLFDGMSLGARVNSDQWSTMWEILTAAGTD